MDILSHLYRSTAELARMAADVDRMSAGRLILGLPVGVEPLGFEQVKPALQARL